MKQLNWYQIFGAEDIPDGKTVLPTDDVQTLLKCAGINNKPYTSLTELFADTETLQSVIASDNAIDYLVRSKDFIKSEALVPQMTDNTHPSGECGGTSIFNSSYDYFNGFNSNASYGWIPTRATMANSIVWHDFGQTKKVKKAEVARKATAGTTTTINVIGSDDKVTWNNLKAEVTINNGTNFSTKNEIIFDSIGAYNSVGIQLLSTSSGIDLCTGNGYKIQFYSEEGFTDNANAMSYIGLSNYASNTLLGDPTWRAAIADSTYSESVLNFKRSVSGKIQYWSDNKVWTPRQQLITFPYVVRLYKYSARSVNQKGAVSPTAFGYSMNNSTYTNFESIPYTDKTYHIGFLDGVEALYARAYGVGTYTTSDFQATNNVYLTVYGRVDV